MFRYVALLWNRRNTAASDVATRLAGKLLAKSRCWQTSLRRPGIWVLHADARPGANQAYVLADDRGVVVGKLFRRNDSVESAAAVGCIEDKESEAILKSAGRDLIENYWGRYVAFLLSQTGNGFHVVRDPIGTLPCFSIRRGEVEIFFSRLDSIEEIGIADFSINWDYVHAHLVAFALDCHETGLEHVSQVLGGERVDCCGSNEGRTLLWDPHQIAKTDVMENREIAALSLRQSVRTCVRAWASSYERILVRLSGGVDSSIVVSCLAADSAIPHVTCVNYHWAGSESDERTYAGRMAEKAKRPLLQRERDAEFSVEHMFRVHSRPKPSSYLAALEYAPIEADLAQSLNTSAVFTGDGGDLLFYQMQDAWPGVDYVARQGFDGGAFGVVLDAARLGRVSFWRALHRAIMNGWLGRPPDLRGSDGDYLKLVDPAIIELGRQDQRFLHPAQRFSEETGPGKLQQIWSVVLATDYYNPFASEDDPEYVCPLLSQPVVETCLRIPTYNLSYGGMPRALVRHAFLSDLPHEVAYRRSKGSVDEPRKVLLRKNRDLLRAELLDGALVARKIIDARKLEEVLSERATTIASCPAELFEYLSLEAWVRSWGAKVNRAAA